LGAFGIPNPAKSSREFHLNTALNGIPLPASGHLTGHSAYNDKIREILDGLSRQSNGVEASYDLLQGFIGYLSGLIKNNPGKNLGEIANLIHY
jgi:hypothetical protein